MNRHNPLRNLASAVPVLAQGHTLLCPALPLITGLHLMHEASGWAYSEGAGEHLGVAAVGNHKEG